MLENQKNTPPSHSSADEWAVEDMLRYLTEDTAASGVSEATVSTFLMDEFGLDLDLSVLSPTPDGIISANDLKMFLLAKELQTPRFTRSGFRPQVTARR